MTPTDFLPVNRNDMTKRGWDSVDFAYVIGDAYVDHPSFGHAIISRVLESRGYLVGIISHVAELKERIDRQVVVTKDRTGGSRVEVIV